MKHIVIKSDADRRDAEAYIRAHGNAVSTGLGEDKLQAARDIVEAVRTRGDAALAEYSARFDGVELRPEQFEVTTEELDAALAAIEPEIRAIIEQAHENIRTFHSKHLRESWEETLPDGTILGQRVTPIESAGVYVPGGKAFYPSSVLMNIVPARVAGVKEIVMVSPPSCDGDIHPVVLAAAKIAGATRVFRIGGAQAVAALAHGTETVPAVSKITGPGNTYVTAAKALVRNVAEIDSEAGPSEVVVLADAAANPQYVAAELICQAEHDEEAMAVLITPSQALADATATAIEEELSRAGRRPIIEEALKNKGAFIVTRDLEEAIALTNLVAPEHLSIQTASPMDVAQRITNAGAMMIGAMTPVAVGDYYAGPNHILPTGRRARFSSPLTAEDFRKVSSIIMYTEEKLRADAANIRRFAEVEELPGHARAVEVRL